MVHESSSPSLSWFATERFSFAGHGRSPCTPFSFCFMALSWSGGGSWQISPLVDVLMLLLGIVPFPRLTSSTPNQTAASELLAPRPQLRNGEVIRSYMKHDNAVTCVALNDITAS